ncbi:MAG: hypothetical protein P8Z37_07265 [Acidobacteriota bacterium]
MASFRDRSLTVFFLMVLFIPVLRTSLSRKEARDGLEEKRQLTQMPGLPEGIEAMIAFPPQFEAYFNDHFPFREFLIRSHNRLKIKLLKKSPLRDVLLGRNGWLFYARNNLLQDFLGLDPLLPEALHARQLLLEAKRDWLASQGIPYLLVVAPNKQTIYPELMPEGYSRSREPSRLDQLLDYLRAHSDIPVLDLRESLLSEKAGEKLYFSTDTHWNPKGAFFGYRRIMETLHHRLDDPRLIPRSLADYRSIATVRGGGDLAVMLGIESDIQESYDQLKPLFTPCSKEEKLSNYLNYDWKPFPEPIASHCTSSELNLVMFHDSFGIGLRPYLSEHFKRSVFVWYDNPDGDLFKAVILKEKPDIVVEEVVERIIPYMKCEPEFRP